MPRRPPVALALVALVAAGCAAQSSSSTTSQGVSVPSVNGVPIKALVACRGLKAQLPKAITPGAELRPVTPVSDTTAAWGTPPITLRCGVPEGSSLDDPYTFNGVRWSQHDVGAARTWTTLGRKVNVVVEVPDAYSGQAELIGSLATAVTRALS